MLELRESFKQNLFKYLADMKEDSLANKLEDALQKTCKMFN